MSVRRAKLDDHWRHVCERPSPTRLDSVSFEGLSCLRDGTIHFRSGINAIVGANGVGKSTLLAAIAELLAGKPTTDALGHSSKLAGSRIRGVVSQIGTAVNLEIVQAGEGEREAVAAKFEGTSRWLEPSYTATQYCKQIHSDQNFDDNLEPLSPIVLSQDELDVASYIVGKTYTSCKIFEVAEYAEFERMPYFKVTADGTTYGSEAMGQGELSLMLVYWTLRDLPKRSILILEEPETHVSPKSQSALMDIVAKFCDEKNLWIVVTTHSPSIVTRVPRANLRLISRGAGPAEVLDSPTNTQIAFLLGGGVAYRGVFLVEDQAAKGFLITLLQELDPDLSAQFEICVTGSDGQISAALTAMPKTRHWLRILGVYDGDTRGKVDASNFKWPATFLPSEVSPEELLIRGLQQHDDRPDLLGQEINRSPEVVGLAFNAADGKDPHDWIFEVAKVATVDYETVLRGMLRIWLQSADNRTNATNFCKTLRGFIDAP
jgi:predicted ATPase